jgi:hypothetical protein
MELVFVVALDPNKYAPEETPAIEPQDLAFAIA